MEFEGFIGGFGKYFFTKGGIKREKERFWRDGRVNLYFFKIFWGEWRRIRNFMGECIFWDYGVGREIFGLSGRGDNIYYL